MANDFVVCPYCVRVWSIVVYRRCTMNNPVIWNKADVGTIYINTFSSTKFGFNGKLTRIETITIEEVLAINKLSIPKLSLYLKYHIKINS